MITEEVTKEQADAWKRLYEEKKAVLKENRITGQELQAYFVGKYHPSVYRSREFEKVVYLNAQEEGGEYPDIVTYILNGDIFVGIDLKSAYFHVECEDTEKMVPVWDDLFIRRGLNRRDRDNFVIAAQYLLLSEGKKDHCEE